MKRDMMKRLFALLLCALLFVSAAPLSFAEAGGDGAAPEEAPPAEEDQTSELPQGNDQRAAEPELNVINADEVQAMVEQTLSELNLQPDQVSIGYVYTPTGEAWYYRGDEWMFSASLYKVPLMMIFAQKEYEGELTADSAFNGLTLKDAEYYILTLSHNEYAHMMANTLGVGGEGQELYKQFTDLPDSYYSDLFYSVRYFSSRFMTEVMKTLYYQQERFPNVIDCLKNANPGEWFCRTGDGQYEIAQKYGSLVEGNKTANNHTSGIIFTPNPFILTVMTKNVGDPQNAVATIKQKFQDYTLQLDGKLEPARQELAQQQALAEQQQIEEDQQIEEQQPQTEQQPQEPVQSQNDEQLQATAQPVNTPASSGKTKSFSVGKLIAGFLVVLVIAAAVLAAVFQLKKRGGGSRGDSDAYSGARIRRPGGARKRHSGGYDEFDEFYDDGEDEEPAYEPAGQAPVEYPEPPVRRPAAGQSRRVTTAVAAERQSRAAAGESSGRHSHAAPEGAASARKTGRGGSDYKPRH